MKQLPQRRQSGWWMGCNKRQRGASAVPAFTWTSVTGLLAELYKQIIKLLIEQAAYNEFTKKCFKHVSHINPLSIFYWPTEQRKLTALAEPEVELLKQTVFLEVVVSQPINVYQPK